MTVSEVMETLPTVTVRDPLESILEQLERHDAVLVRSPSGLQAVATSSDVLRFFYRVSRPYIVLKEIELGLRDLMHMRATDDELRLCTERALSAKYKNLNKPTPSTLEEVTFEDYRTVLAYGKNNEVFHRVFTPASLTTLVAKLDRVREIRNSVFHFKSTVSVRDFEALVGTRDWLFRIRNQARRQEDRT
jgi:hypothetical protein